MSNYIQSRGSRKFQAKIKLFIASALILALSGCLSESDTGGVFNRVKNPSGTVTGLVQDTNGNPLAGAIVSVAGKTIKTDAQGRYTAEKVPVSNVEGNDNDDTPFEFAQRINIFVAPPEETEDTFLTATISVIPLQAEIDGSNVSEMNDPDPFGPQNFNAGGMGNTIQNGAVTFVDGFIIEAPVIQLPALDNKVSGFLVDHITGLPISEKLVYLNVGSPNTVGSNGMGFHVTLQDVNIAANTVTNELGEFVIENVPNDTSLNLVVNGYNFVMASDNESQDGSGHIDTRIENDVFLGNVYMSSVIVGDDRPPVITEVSIYPTTNIDSIEGRTEVRTIKVTLSEDIATEVTDNAVFVNYEDATSGQRIYMELAAIPSVEGNTITIETVEDISSINNLGDILVSFARSNFSDAAGNSLDLTSSREFQEFLKPNNSAWLDLPIDTFALRSIATQVGRPFITSIDGVAGGVTDSSVVATLVVRFSKPVQQIPNNLKNNSLFVMVGPEAAGNNNNFDLLTYKEISANLDPAGLSLTIELLDGDLPQLADIRVDLLQNAFIDEDGLSLTVNPSNVDDSGFEDITVNGFVRVDFISIHGREAVPVTLAQLLENDQENDPIPTHKSFKSVSENPFGQLNSQDDDDGNNIPDTVERLGALKQAIGSGGGINVDRTLISFALVPNAIEYELIALDSDGARKPFAVEALQGLEANLVDPEMVTVQADGTGQDPLITLSGVSPGDRLSMAAIDALGIKTFVNQSDSILLKDNIPPAVVLQRAYSLGGVVVAQSNSFGSGAELSAEENSDENFGVPFFDITPGLLGVVQGGVNSLSVTDLTENFQQSPAVAGANVGAVYDNAAYDAWSPIRTMGIAVSEDSDFVSGRNLGQIIDGIDADQWDIINDITTDDQGNTLGSADLITFNANPIEMSLNMHNEEINFSGYIMDSSGNIMENDNGSKVIVRDRIPPLVKSASIIEPNGFRRLGLEFNESINFDTIDVTYNGIPLNFLSIENDSSLIFELPLSSEIVNSSYVFVNGRNFDLIDTSNVEDQHGNSWASYENQPAPGGIQIPRIVVERQ